MKYYLNFFLIITSVNFCYPNLLDHFGNNDIMLQFENEIAENINHNSYESNRQ